MTYLLMTPQAHNRACAAATTYLNGPEINAEGLVDAVLAAIPEPEIIEPANGSMIRAVWANDSVHIFERKDEQAPSDDGLVRPWYSLDDKVWLTWEILNNTIKHEQGTITVYAPMQAPS